MTSPKCASKLALRLAFGLSLALIGLSHYMMAAQFAGMTAAGIETVPVLGTLAMIWGYVLPALEILGGLSLALGLFRGIGSLLAGIALASIPVGLLLKAVVSGAMTPETGTWVVNTFIWMLVYVKVVKYSSCGSCCTAGAGAAGCATGGCCK